MNLHGIQIRWWTGLLAGSTLIFPIICFIVPHIREHYLNQQLADINLESMLIQNGDLPAGFKSGGITNLEPHYYKFTQAKSRSILTEDGNEVGNVSAYLFSSDGEKEEMYGVYSEVESQEGIIPYEVTGIGDCETCIPVFSLGGCDIRIVFTRCTAMIYFELHAACNGKDYNFDSLVAHARRLDQELKTTVCY